MLLADHRVPERVVLQIELQDRAGKLGPLFNSQAGRKAASRHIAHDNFKRDDFHLADKLLAHVQATDEVGGYADALQPHHKVFGDAVVEHRPARDRALLLIVEGGCVVLEVLNKGSGLGTLERTLPCLRRFVCVAYSLSGRGAAECAALHVTKGAGAGLVCGYIAAPETSNNDRGLRRDPGARCLQRRAFSAKTG